MAKPGIKQIIDDNQIINIAKQCAERIKEKKGKDILILDLRKVNSYLEYFIIATGNSQIHCNALAKDLSDFMDSLKLKGYRKPIFDSGWIALDYNEIVIHIFNEDLRNYYQLERLWADAEII